MPVHLVIPLVHLFRYPHINQSPQWKVAASTRATTSSGYSYPVNVFLRKCCYRLHWHCLIWDRYFDANLNGHVAERATGLAGSGRGFPSGKQGAGAGAIRCRYTYNGNASGPAAACGPACCGPGPPAGAGAGIVSEGRNCRTCSRKRYFPPARLSICCGSFRSSGPAAVPVRSGTAAVAAAAAVLLRSAVAIRIINGSRGPGAYHSGRGPGRVCSRVRVGVRAGARISCRARAGSWGRSGGRRRCCRSWTRRFHTGGFCAGVFRPTAPGLGRLLLS